MAFEFPSGTSDYFEPYFQFFESDAGSIDMNVDGSVTPQTFRITSDMTHELWVDKIEFVILHNKSTGSGANWDDFGNITGGLAENEGCTMILHESNGNTVDFFDGQEIRDNWHFSHLCGNEVLNENPILICTWDVQKSLGARLHLAPNEYIEFTINANLNVAQIVEFHVMAHGIQNQVRAIGSLTKSEELNLRLILLTDAINNSASMFRVYLHYGHNVGDNLNAYILGKYLREGWLWIDSEDHGEITPSDLTLKWGLTGGFISQTLGDGEDPDTIYDIPIGTLEWHILSEILHMPHLIEHTNDEFSDHIPEILVFPWVPYSIYKRLNSQDKDHIGELITSVTIPPITLGNSAR
jgi:hypothetical protein